MSEPQDPPAVPPPPESAPPPPPAAPPPAAPPAGGSSENRSIFLVLAYLGPLALIPFLMEEKDQEVRWHAKHGLVLFGAEVLIAIAFTILSFVPILGCIVPIIWLVVGLGLLVFHIMCMVKAINNGERLTVPVISELADRF